MSSKQKSNKEYLHSLLEGLLLKAIREGESRTIIVKIPFYELAYELDHKNYKKGANSLDLKITMTAEYTDDDNEAYQTGPDFAIQNKTRN